MPPLNAVRAFEAAARLGNFSAAAHELGLSQSAVSRRIFQLEDHLGVTLFHRTPRRVTLTPHGRDLLAAVTPALDALAEAAAKLRPGPGEIRLKAPPAFAVRWLIPRLARFRRLSNGVAVHLTTAWAPVDLRHEDFDAGIVYTTDPPPPDWPLLFADGVVPVCAPALAQAAGPSRDPAALARFRLLLGSADGRDWRRWAAAKGVGGLRLDDALMFESDEPALLAAAAGHGVALACPRLVAADLAAGRLVRLFGLAAVTVGYYALALPAPPPPPVLLFRDWLLREACNPDPCQLALPLE